MLKPFQNTILEMIAKDRPLAETAARLCREAEQLAPGAACTILTVDHDGKLHPLASPSLPESYSKALDGLAIGPDVGSCGTAAFRRTPVEVTDIARDPLWAPYAHMVEPLGLKACWSSPIVGPDGSVLASFAFYFRDKRGPNDLEKALVLACLDLCVIALERDRVRSDAARLAYFDTLTGLPNRASFNRALATAAGADSRFAAGLLMADIDHLKHVNDTFGHSAGDDLIRDVAQRLAANAAPGTAYRLSGDEFAVFVAGPADPEQIERISRQVLDAMKAPAGCGGYSIAPTMSIGGSVSGPHGAMTSELLCRQADLALYYAKEHHRGEFVPFTAGLGSNLARRSRSIRCLSDALTHGRIEAHYQPILRLDTREVVGLEALCRMRTKDGKLANAGAFADAIQDASNSVRLTECMMAQVAADIRFWLDQGVPVQHVGLNVTVSDFRRGDLKDRLSAAFGQHGVPLKHVVIEVTEAVYLKRLDRSIAQALENLRSEGLLVALDDFGTGYASLTHLLSVPVDIIKIDRSFVERLEPGDAGEVIVAGLIGIANKLGIRIVAEGIETVRQARQLEALGCNLGQGFLFAAARDRHATTDMLLRLAQSTTPEGTRRSAAEAA